MDSLRVNVAVLLVTDAHTAADEATVKLIIDRITTAGHHIAECEVLADRQQLVRAQFLKWIADPEVDVIITIAGVETTSAQPALEPSITRPIEGFAELVRMISYEEIGTGAMLVDVAAAQCSSTFVFVLPASMGAVRSALDKLLVPQLDSRTRPRNLVMRMPRLKSSQSQPPANVEVKVVANDAVPVSITSEKTALGVTPPAGPRMPRPPTPPPPPPRARLTPPIPVKVIVPARMRNEEVVELTKPKVPPESQAATKLKELWKEPEPEPVKPISPTAWAKPVTPIAGVPAKSTVVGVEPAKPLAFVTAKLESTAPEAKAYEPKAALPSVVAKSDEAKRTLPLGSVPDGPKPDEAKATLPLVNAEADAPKPAPLAKLELAKAPAPAGGVRDIVETTRTSPGDPRAATPVAGGVRDIVETTRTSPSDPRAAAESGADLLSTDPPSPASLQRRNVVPPISVEAAIEPVTATAVSAPSKRPSTEDALVLDDAELIPDPPKPPAPPPLPPRKKAPTGSVDDIPTFLPPRIAEPPLRRRRRNNVPLILAALAFLASAAAAGVVMFSQRAKRTEVANVLPDRPVVVDAAVAVITPDAAEPEPAVQVDPEPPIDAAVVEEPPPEPPPVVKQVKPPPRKPPRTDPRPDPKPDIVKAPTNPPAGDCDEVACILEKYARPCCARYKPSVPDPKPVGAIAATLDKNMIRSGVDRVRPAIIRCGELSSGTKGTVKVAVAVSPAGTVSAVSVATSPDPTLGQCVANAVRRASFAKTQDGATFSYPFVF